MPNHRFTRAERRDISGAGIYGNAIQWIAEAQDNERPACIELIATLYCVGADVVGAHVRKVRNGESAPKSIPAQSRPANA